MGALRSDPLGMHRVLDSPRVLPQAAARLDCRRELWDDETRIRVEMLNLDAASYRQLREQHRAADGTVDGAALRADVLSIVAHRGKMQNPVTGSGGMLIGRIEEIGPRSPLGHLAVGDQVATLVSLSLTPLVIEDGLESWEGSSERVPCDGYAVLFGRTIAAVLPTDLPTDLALSVLDVCGAPALTARVTKQYAGLDRAPTVAVIGASGKSGSLSLAAAKDAVPGARTIGVVPTAAEESMLRDAGLADEVVVADATDPLALREAMAATGGPADVTVVCVDVPGCEGGALLATAEGGTIIFFSMATSFSAAALGAEGLVADVTMLVGTGYLPGHADYAVQLLRGHDGLRTLFEERIR